MKYKNIWNNGLLVLLSISLTFSAHAGNIFHNANEVPPFLKFKESQWVDSLMENMSLKEKIGQLFMVAAYSNKGADHREKINQLIEEYHIGGLIFFQGGPVRQATLTNHYQETSDIPLMIGMDGEWGLGMRLDSTISFPYQMGLGAVQDNQLIYKMGEEIARQCKRLGVHINFAPVVDVNNNPQNPVINYRSFGENKNNVAAKGIAYMQGMQDHQVLASAKHFPGHGDTDTDSHHDLPVIKHSQERLDSLELFPFRKLIEEGLGSVMVAHLQIPALDSTENLASTLSRPIVSGLLQEKLGFKGLKLTDALNMQGVAKYFEPGNADLQALKAGNDVLLFPEDVPAGVKAIQEALEKGEITTEMIEEKCRKILAFKKWAGLDQFKPVQTKGLVDDLNTPEAELLKRNLAKASLTVMNNDSALIPVKTLQNKKIATLAVGVETRPQFQITTDKYVQADHYQISNSALENEGAALIDEYLEKLASYDLVLLSLHNLSMYPSRNYGISPSMVTFVEAMAEQDNTILSIFGNAYALSKFNQLPNSQPIVLTYQHSRLHQDLAAQMIFGAFTANGRLPVNVNDKYRMGSGNKTVGSNRFEYTIPEDAGMNGEYLYRKVDSLVNVALDVKAIPGCQVLVARNQKVVMFKSYGLHAYADTIKVRNHDVYDLASITKISGALPVLMQLYDSGKFHLQAGLENYLPSFIRSNKAGIPMRDILAHQGRLKPYIVYWKNTLRNNGSYKWWTLDRDSSRRFPYKVSENLYLHRNYEKKIIKTIRKSPLLEEKEYRYSGLAFYLFPTIIENITGENYRKYVNTHFYEPLGAHTLGYNPLERIPENRIIPTENDFNFRHKLINGRVHDEGAAMMPGLSSNAGLFANANDLAKLMQMYLNMGQYGGKRYISENTLKEFTSYPFRNNDNRRGLGFDKPQFERDIQGNSAPAASDASFGHSGFTGTFTWADPKENLLYVFLSNRVHPTRQNHRIYELDTRTRIQQVLYDAINANTTAALEN